MEKLNEKEIPYEELEMIGISKEQFLDLPKKAIDQIMTGRLSPMLELENGIQAKFAVKRGEDGKPHIFVFPRRNEIANDLNLKKEDLEKLKNNEVIVASIKKDGKDEKIFIQMDEETKTLITARKDDIHIPNAIGDIVLGNKDKDYIREGKPIELEKENTRVTVGVDLNSQGGFRIMDGSLDEWRKKKLIEWDRATPGVKGYWNVIENVLKYEEYNKQKRNVGEDVEEQQQQRSSFRMKR